MKLIAFLYRRVSAPILVAILLALLAVAYIRDRNVNELRRAEICKERVDKGWTNACAVR